MSEMCNKTNCIEVITGRAENHINNMDVYVTGSNSKFLSRDIITEFRGRGDEIHVYPLSFKEFMNAYEGDRY